MKTLQAWLDEYGQSHTNKTNKIIHWICIPLIFWSIISLLSLIPHNYIDIFNSTILNELMHVGTLIIFLGLIFYIRLSFNIFLGMLIFSICVLVDIYLMVYLFKLNKFWGLFNFVKVSPESFLLYKSLIIFTFAWTLQFIGHKIEGKKPSFLQDVQFLLIGPAWLLAFIYNKLSIKF